MQSACAILFCHQRSLALSHKRHDFREGGGVMDTKCVFWFSIQLLPEIFVILIRIQRDVLFYCILMKLEFSQQFMNKTIKCTYKVVQIWQGRFVCKQVRVCPGHIWTTLYYYILCLLITPTCFGRLLWPSSGCTVLESRIKSLCGESVQDLSL